MNCAVLMHALIFHVITHMLKLALSLETTVTC